MSEATEQRTRPPDPAGTQPKVDPRSLEPPPGGTQLVLRSGPELLPTLAPAPASPAPTADSSTEPPHAARFQFLFGALGALGVAAIALAAMLLSAPAKAPPRPWSAWKPGGDGIDPAQQIADHVAPLYKLDDGKQIVQVSGGPPALKGRPLTLGIVKSGQAPARLEGNSVLYQLCGGGSDCAIKEGKPSLQRGLLVSREALELALYTFRYVGGVDQVIVTMPPAPAAGASTAGKSSKATGAGAPTKTAGSTSAGSTAGGSTAATHHALMFRAQDLSSLLDRPLALTLSSYTPRVSQMDGSVDAPLVRQLTGTRLYDYVLDEGTQSGGPVMLLEPPGLGG